MRNSPGLPDLGIATCLTGSDRYVPSFSSRCSRSRCRSNCASNSSRVWPSIPPAPQLAFTRSQARCRFFRLYTLSINEWTFLAPVGLIQSASLLGRRCTGLSLKGNCSSSPPYSLTSWFVFNPTLFVCRLPRRLLAADCSVTTVSHRFRYYSAVRRLAKLRITISLALIGSLTLAASQRLSQSSWGHVLFFRTVPSANTLVRRVNENAFASIVQARPCPAFGRPVHLRGSPHRLRPGTSPHALRIPPRDGHPALRRNFPSASEALPPLLDTVILIRSPEGLEPSWTTRCSAHTTAQSDFSW